MTITLQKDSTPLVLPDDLIWADEFTWAAVAQATERGITGALILDAMLRNGGRPITLSGQGDSAWITRADLLTLQSWMLLPGQTFTLNLRGESFAVVFDHGTAEDTQAMAVQAVIDYSDTHPDDYYCSLRLRFLTV